MAFQLIERRDERLRIEQALRHNSAVAVVGPRQCGKTTLCREFVPQSSINYFDLESPESLARLDEPVTALSRLNGLVLIDEIQNRPELFPVLRVLIDRKREPGQYLLLGSASIDLLRQTSESLAGRIEIIELSGFSLSEVGSHALEQHWLRGGFPLSYLPIVDGTSFNWRKSFIRTYLERELLQLGLRTPASTLRRFWTMLIHYHGQIRNLALLARALSTSEATARHYADLLEDLFMLRQLQPWHANLKKRQIKAPKLYLRDTGLLHYFLGVKTLKQLLEHPSCGASWEGYIIEEILKILPVDDSYFWGTHSGAELDLLLLHEGRKYGVECKRTDAPRITPSMVSALSDLELEKLTVIYPGEKAYQLAEKIYVMPMTALATSQAESIIGG
jgi:predicted AAA+ superfamily ATPase